MISDGQGLLLSAWWVSVFPAGALIVAVVAIHLVGDGIRDALDPRNHPDAAHMIHESTAPILEALQTHDEC